MFNYMGQNQPQNAMYGAFPNRCEIIRVNGENGARAFSMMPNSSVLLLDENNPLVWLVQTDGAGYKTFVANSMGNDITSFCAKMAKAFLEDKDAEPNKLYNYYHSAVLE